MERITLKKLLEFAKRMGIDEDAELMFQYRENFPSEGRDFNYPVTHVHALQGVKGKRLCLVGVIIPEISQK